MPHKESDLVKKTIMNRQKSLLIIVLTLLLFSCFSPRDKDEGFYSCFSEDWDLSIIPLIKPYFLSSCDHGKSWGLSADSIINYNTNNSIDEVTDFGISKNYFFGKDESKWFLFDTKSKLFAYYDTKEELFDCMNSFEIPITKMKSCTEYEKDCDSLGYCYWFPKQGEEYNDYLDLKPNDIINLTAYDDSIKGVGFLIDPGIKFHRNHIYFFKLNITGKSNDLLYFEINRTSHIPIKKDTIIPVFINTKTFDIALYTPLSVAQKKGISEKKRIHIQKQITIFPILK